jgi:hypothetical protein
METHARHFRSRKANRAVDSAVSRLRARNRHCRDVPAVFVRDWIDSFVYVLVEAGEKGDNTVARDWIAGDAPLRMRGGFDLADIVDALDESERAAAELLDRPA